MNPTIPRSALPHWQARLALAFQAAGGATRLVHNRHSGPLRLLKALDAEDGQAVEAVIVHPPGGLASGDTVEITIDVGDGCRVVATTPGAQKWYRAEEPAQAATRLTVGANALLEWLPQPAILFDGARADQSLSIHIAAGGASIGWEQLVRGRGAMGERFATGSVTQSIELAAAGRVLWRDRLVAAASDRLFASPIGWDNRPVAASVWCCAPTLPPERLVALRDAWRDTLDQLDANPDGGASIRGGATIVTEGLLIARLLGDDSEAVQDVCAALWRAARISLTGAAGAAPRIWRT